MHRAVEVAASGIEAFAVAVIVISFFFATLRFLLRAWQKQEKAYDHYKLMLERSMLLGLTFLIAADVINTVALAPTLPNIGILAVLVVVRTLLGWSLVVELEGHVPWQSAAVAAQTERGRADDARTHVDGSTGGLDKTFRGSVAVPFPPATRDGEQPSLMRKVGTL
jgi:uncharacterized membrane protein